MNKIKQLLTRLGGWEYAGLCLLVLVVLVLHFSTIMQPKALVFDEQYYVPDARSILQGEGSARIEHPPLGKLIITAGIFLFGDNPFGWRFFSVLFGAIGIILFYLICRELKLSHRTALLATFLLSLENLSFIQASIAMLDVYSLTFMLASFWFYLKGQNTAAGASIGLAALAKLSGALALPVIVLHWLLTDRNRPWRFLASMLAAPAVFLLLMPLLDFAVWHKFISPIERLCVIFKSSQATFADYPSQILSRPWDWILRPEILTYWIEPHYLAMISPSIWAVAIPVTLYTLFRAIKGSRAAVFSLAWFAGTYLFWIPVSLISDRISYIYYFYPTIGALCLGLGLVSEQLSGLAVTAGTVWIRKVSGWLIPAYLLIHLTAFVILTPVSYWWKLACAVALYVVARYFLANEPLPAPKPVNQS